MCDRFSEKDHQLLRQRLKDWELKFRIHETGCRFFFQTHLICIVGFMFGCTKINDKETILHFENLGRIHYVVTDTQGKLEN